MSDDTGPGWDEADDAILAGVRALVDAADPVPAGMADRTRFALTVHALHAEVAELTRTEALAVRAAEEPVPTESMTFTSGSLSLMLSARDDGAGTLRLDGWVTRGGAQVEVCRDGGPTTVTADGNGRFVLTGLAHGSVYFVVRDASLERPVVTPTVLL